MWHLRHLRLAALLAAPACDGPVAVPEVDLGVAMDESGSSTSDGSSSSSTSSSAPASSSSSSSSSSSPDGESSSGSSDESTGAPPEPGGECCSGNGSPGCDDAACQAFICDSTDETCCSGEWDQVCADWATDLCDVCGACAIALHNCDGDTPCCADLGLSCGNVAGQDLCCLIAGETFAQHPLECCSQADADEDGRCD